MRTSQRVTFISEKESEYYDDVTGDWERMPIILTTLPAFIMDLGIDRSVQLFGEYKKGRKVVILQQPLLAPFSYIEIQGEKYIAVKTSLEGKAFYVEVV